MAAKAVMILGPSLGGVEITACTSDDDFFRQLEEQQWSAVLFAPGACRHNAAGSFIPGGRAETQGWSLVEYRAAVKERQGADVIIVETTEEQKIVPLLRKALGLAP